MNTCAQSKPAEAKLRATVPPTQTLCLQLCVIAVYLKTFHRHREGLKLSGAINVEWWQTRRRLRTAREKIKRFPLRNKHLAQRNLWMNECFTVTPQTQPNKGFCKFDQHANMVILLENSTAASVTAAKCVSVCTQSLELAAKPLFSIQDCPSRLFLDTSFRADTFVRGRKKGRGCFLSLKSCK